MMRQRVTVIYRDETEATTYLTQYSLSQFAVYCNSKGIEYNPADNANPLLGVLMLRFQAWCELFADTTQARPAFEAWDRTVIEVNPEKAEPVNPTLPTVSED